MKLSIEFATFFGECRVLLAALFLMVDTIRPLFIICSVYLPRFATVLALSHGLPGHVLMLLSKVDV